MTKRKRTLLISSILLLPIMLLWFQFTTTVFGAKWGYITGLIGYWAYCLLAAWLLGGLERGYLKDAWNEVSKNRYAKYIYLAAFIPVIPTFFGVFLPAIPKLSIATGALVVFTSVVNGPIEEFYWRGLYLVEYRENKWLGFILSTLLFGAWHFAVWFAHGVEYRYGVLGQVGGAYLLGALWAWVTSRLGSFRAAAFAHILVNLFALSGLFVDNGF